MSIPKIEDLLDEIKELRAVLCEVLMAEAIPAEDEIYQSTPSSVWEILEENLCNRAGAAAKIRFTPSAEEVKRAEAWHLQHIIEDVQHIIEHGCSVRRYQFKHTGTGLAVFAVCKCGAEQDVTEARHCTIGDKNV